VKVGSVAHPMEEKHYIEWIEVIADGKAYRQFLKPVRLPKQYFKIEAAEITPGILQPARTLEGLTVMLSTRWNKP